MARLASLFAMIAFTHATFGQQLAQDMNALRSKAQYVGSIELKVVTRTAAAFQPSAGVRTSEQTRPLSTEEEALIERLLAEGSVVGNEISMQPDGSFTMRVIARAFETLASHPAIVSIAEVAATTRSQL